MDYSSSLKMILKTEMENWFVNAKILGNKVDDLNNTIEIKKFGDSLEREFDDPR